VQFWWYLVHSFLNKFAAKWCKRFPPHLNDVSTLPCETWNAHLHMLPLSCYRKQLQNWSHLSNLLLPNSPDLSPFDNIVWEILQEKLYITDLELSTTPLTNGCHSDDMIQLGPLRSPSFFSVHYYYKINGRNIFKNSVRSSGH